MPKIDPAGLRPYEEAGYALIPLHKWDSRDDRNRKRGKSPLHRNWTTRPTPAMADIRKHMEDGGNAGVRLRAYDLVVDIDPRNFPAGDDSWEKLRRDTGLDLSDYPTVATGGGGYHIYMTKPENVSVRDSLPGYDGVEFKTIGGQVVAAGSLHPSGSEYKWVDNGAILGALDPAPAAPEKLLILIRRPAARNRPSGAGGEHTPEELAAMLEALEPEDFRDHDDWFTLMQACHHATAGDGRAEFVEWSTRDPEFADHGAIIGQRWDSLRAAPEGPAITHRTLHKFLLDRNKGDAIPRTPPADDFDDPIDFAGIDGLDGSDNSAAHEKRGPLEKMNERYWAVMDGGQFMLMWEDEDPETAIPEKNVPARNRWTRAKVGDFKLMLANERLQRDERTVPKADAWLEWAGRRSARGVVFDPEHDHDGFLNLWTGWGTDPNPNGSWKRLEELLYEVLCDGDEDVFRYVLDWAAYMVQRPARPAEVAICFQGGKGVGKGTWGRALTRLAGRHGMQVTSSELLTGRFNAHLRDVVLLFADEAIKAYDRDGESRLKGLLTEPRLAYEGKGRDVVSGRNMIHVVMASNEEWFIPAGLDGERRFMLTRANETWQGKHARFAALHTELETGGYGRLLWDLLNRDLGDWAPRDRVPATEGILRQKLMSMGPVQQWWFNALREGEPPCETAGDAEWALEPVRIFKQDLRQSFEEHCRAAGIRHPGGMGRALDRIFLGELRALCPETRTEVKARIPVDRPDIRPLGDGRAWCIELPPLMDCRQALEAQLGQTVNW